jgi:glycine betaine/proline transport system permease protein
MLNSFKQSRLSQFALLLVVFFALCWLVPKPEGYKFLVSAANSNSGTENWLWRLPDLLAWVPQWLADGINYIMFDWITVDVYNADLEENEAKSVVKEITRSLSWFVLFFIQSIREFLVGGLKTIVMFTSWDFINDNPWAKLPGLPWTVVTGGAILLGYNLGGRFLAVLVGASLTYISLFGQWEPAMKTLSLVLVAASISVLFGLLLGIAAYRSKLFEQILSPILGIAQTMPQFSYLVPMFVLFGLGDHAGALATIVFATPPMVRLTLLGLKSVPPEVVEAGLMSGCTRRQLMFGVMLPSARQNILVGVNQVIMQCLAMVVIASLIGATGIGDDLLKALNGLKLGKAFELGVCIVLIAITLDKLSLAWANKPIDYFANLSFSERHRNKFILLAILVAGVLLALIGRSIFDGGINYFFIIDTNKGLTTESFLDAGIDWMVTAWFRPLEAFKAWVFVDVLEPVRSAFRGMPAIATFTLVMGIGYIIGGFRSALIVGGYLLFIALTAWWDRALTTAYFVAIALLIAGSLGALLGIVFARSARASKVALIVCDTLQTFPSFIYLIPAIMLFQVSNIAVLIAITPYAMIPALRYTIEGLRNVSPSLQDAGSMSGVSRMQRLFSIELPLAFPHMVLGINQTVMFALAMVIIGAMIGSTQDLGELILGSLSDANGIGTGLILGLNVAFMGLIIDHLLNTWARERKEALGLA